MSLQWMHVSDLHLPSATFATIQQIYAFQFQQLIKVNPGVWPPTVGQLPTGMAADSVGTTYPLAISPATPLELNGMTLDQSSRLAECNGVSGPEIEELNMEDKGKHKGKGREMSTDNRRAVWLARQKKDARGKHPTYRELGKQFGVEYATIGNIIRTADKKIEALSSKSANVDLDTLIAEHPEVFVNNAGQRRSKSKGKKLLSPGKVAATKAPMDDDQQQSVSQLKEKQQRSASRAEIHCMKTHRMSMAEYAKEQELIKEQKRKKKSSRQRRYRQAGLKAVPDRHKFNETVPNENVASGDFKKSPLDGCSPTPLSLVREQTPFHDKRFYEIGVSKEFTKKAVRYHVIQGIKTILDQYVGAWRTCEGERKAGGSIRDRLDGWEFRRSKKAWETDMVFITPSSESKCEEFLNYLLMYDLGELVKGVGVLVGKQSLIVHHAGYIAVSEAMAQEKATMHADFPPENTSGMVSVLLPLILPNCQKSELNLERPDAVERTAQELAAERVAQAIGLRASPRPRYPVAGERSGDIAGKRSKEIAGERSGEIFEYKYQQNRALVLANSAKHGPNGVGKLPLGEYRLMLHMIIGDMPGDEAKHTMLQHNYMPFKYKSMDEYKKRCKQLTLVVNGSGSVGLASSIDIS